MTSLTKEDFTKLWILGFALLLLVACGNETTEANAKHEPVAKSEAKDSQVVHASIDMPQVVFPEKHLEFFDLYCMDCHNADSQKGEVNLESLSFTIQNIEQAENWQKVLHVLNSKEMPPEDKTQPDEGLKADFLDDLSQTMVSARKVLSDAGGKITMRRLNKRDYQNTIISLLGVELDKAILPEDGSSGDFDTVGSSLLFPAISSNSISNLGVMSLMNSSSAGLPAVPSLSYTGLSLNKR